MTASLKLKGLIVFALISGLSSITTVNAERSDHLAPEATPAEVEMSFHILKQHLSTQRQQP